METEIGEKKEMFSTTPKQFFYQFFIWGTNRGIQSNNSIFVVLANVTLTNALIIAKFSRFFCLFKKKTFEVEENNEEERNRNNLKRGVC